MNSNNENFLLKLKEDDIKITNKKQILTYINNFGYTRIVDCYGAYLKKQLNKKISTKQIIEFFVFDQRLSNLIISYIFQFEQRFNNITMDEIFKFNNLDEDYVLTITNNPAHSPLRNRGYLDFINDIYANINSCNLIDKTKYQNEKLIPLKILSLSWSFHTLIAFVNLQDQQVIKNITRRFGLNEKLDNEFISICHSIRKFRNNLSHNGMCISSYLNYYCREFNKILNYILNANFPIDSPINIKKLIVVLEYLLDTKIINKTLKILLKQNKTSKLLSNKII